MADPIRPLAFGGIRLENNLLQAPLAGFSNAPFRFLAWREGRPGLLATEMISAKALVMGNPEQEQYLARLPGEGPVSYQLWGNEPEALGEAARIVTDRGADVVDLNSGCPVRKVRAAGAGSRLMEDPALLHRIVRAMRAGTDRPLSVKIRVGTSANAMNGVAVARAAAEGGADLVTVHGRHAKESYGTPVRLGEIAEVVAALSIPVVANGDARDGASTRRLFEATGCAGVMVARACMGAPWVFRKIREECAGGVFDPPSRRRIGELFLEHHDRLAELIGPDRAIRHCRKLGSFYSRGLPGARDFRSRLNDCHCRADLATLVAEVYADGGSLTRTDSLA